MPIENLTELTKQIKEECCAKSTFLSNNPSHPVSKIGNLAMKHSQVYEMSNSRVPVKEKTIDRKVGKVESTCVKVELGSKDTNGFKTKE